MKKLFVLVPVVLFLIGCGGGEKDYWPLSVGNVWEYQSQTKVTTPDTTFTITDSLKIEITGETTLNNGKKVFEAIMSNGGGDTTYWEKTDDYVFIYDNKADTEPDTALVLPLEEGKTWNFHKDSLYTETIKIIGKESVTVPAGTYDDCWKAMDIYSSTSITETSYVWLAPDVGQVKMIRTESDTNYTMETKLELYNVTIK
ncbi:MAG: hypothetical protein N3A65_01145 [candidate division WOR-3 bacterium]|nr:hypothetical protein [candidate division WOR-3 bacterium]